MTDEQPPPFPAIGSKPALDQFASFAGLSLAQKTERYSLRLYVTGLTPRSTRAIENIRQLCESHLHDRYDLEVVDIYQQPALAKSEQILAAPTLIKRLPLPLRRIIGDMSNRDRVLLGLDLLRAGSP